MMKLWISCDPLDEESEREFLESLGVKIGHYNGLDQEFRNCELTDEAMDNLDPHWGRFYWGIELGEEMT